MQPGFNAFLYPDKVGMILQGTSTPRPQISVGFCSIVRI